MAKSRKYNYKKPNTCHKFLKTACTFYNNRDDAGFVCAGCGHGDAEVFALVIRRYVSQHQCCVPLQYLVCIQARSSFVLVSRRVVADHEAGVAVACAAHHGFLLVPHDPRTFAVGLELTGEHAVL